MERPMERREERLAERPVKLKTGTGRSVEQSVELSV